MVQRLSLLAELEPYNHYTVQEVLELQAKGIATKEDVIMKINFADYIKRFERENMDISQFGESVDYNAKIKAISDRLKEYVSEVITNQN